MLVFRDQNAGQNREIKIGNRSFENVSIAHPQLFREGVTFMDCPHTSKFPHDVVIKPNTSKFEGSESVQNKYYEINDN
jgi:hypothetical protein